ncbi:MAG: aldolase/citrate lyase family protein, partial [Pseudomonadota bacterium]
MRSWLFVPADSEKKLAKAFTTDADIVILDLEDSIAPDRKGLARGLAREAIAEAGRRRLRPILMTSLTTVLALMPLAF